MRKRQCVVAPPQRITHRGPVKSRGDVILCCLMEHEQHSNDGAVEALKELGEALYAVHKRLISEGYTYIDGKYVHPTKDET